MADFKKLQLKKFPQNKERETAEDRYWNNFREPFSEKLVAKVTDVHFSQAKPYDFACTSSARVTLFDGKTCKLKKNINRFKEVAYGGSYRRDGKLLVAGGETKIVKVFDMSSRAVLRMFRGHSEAIHATKFSQDLTHVMSASDDKTLRYWALSGVGQENCTIFKGHTDFVRSVVQSEHAQDVWVSGGYDHQVKVWNTKTGQCTLTMDHGAQVEDVVFLPGGGLVASCGGTVIRVWDILSGGRLVHEMSNHTKTVTALCVDSSSSRLLSASLDHHVKVYDLASYKVTHSKKFDGAILSLGISPDNSVLVVGLASGVVSIRRRRLPQAALHQPKPVAQAIKQGGTKRYFDRGASYRGDSDDFKVQAVKKQRLRPFDVLLRKFRYFDALNAAMKSQHAITVISVLDELVQRCGLRIALGNRSEETLAPVLQFVQKHIVNPHYTDLLVHVANTIFDIYGSIVGQSPSIDALFLKLKRRLTEEISLHQDLFHLQGCMEMLIASSHGRRTPQDSLTASPAQPESESDTPKGADTNPTPAKKRKR